MRLRAQLTAIVTRLPFTLPAVLLCTPTVIAQAAKTPDYQAQAEYLYNLAKFVRWPESSHSAVTICVAGPEGYLDALQRVALAEEGAESLAVRAVEKTEQTSGCDILFLENKEHAREWIEAGEGKPELTVSDLPDFLDHGGMIQLTPAEDRVRFSVDLRPVANSGLSLSSELLKVATTIRGAGGEEVMP